MALYNTVIVFDQATKLAYVVTWVHLDRHASLQEAYQHGQRQLQITSRKIENEHSPNLTNGKVGNLRCMPHPAGTTSEAWSKHDCSLNSGSNSTTDWPSCALGTMLTKCLAGCMQYPTIMLVIPCSTAEQHHVMGSFWVYTTKQAAFFCTI